MVIDLAAVGRALVLVETADAAAIEITQVAGIADRLQIEPASACMPIGSPMSRQNARTPITSAAIA
jgi:hypothetical protein